MEKKKYKTIMENKVKTLLVISLFVGAVTFGQQLHTVKIASGDSKQAIIEKASNLVPTLNQYNYKKLEYSCFVHFGLNTFTAKEWGDGFEDPKIFNPSGLDTDQWCRVAKEAGMKMVMITVKHHDGFVLWQSRYTQHGIMSSPFQDGKGDVLRELSKSCKKYGLKMGVYLSPADLYQIENKAGLYGNLSEYSERIIPRPVKGRPFKDKRTFKFVVDDYNEYFLNQLFELLTEYGPVHEVWFDGAHPKRKGGQKYNYLAWKELIKTLAPEAVVFGKEDVRWIGNESGTSRGTEWDVVTFEQNPSQMNMFPDMHGDLGSREQLYKGKYLHFLPGEADTSIREGWFYRNDGEQGVRSADDVFDMYERCIGSNTNLLLNIPPNRDGLFPERDVRSILEAGRRIQETYDINEIANAKGEKALLDGNENTYVLAENGKGTYEFKLPATKLINRFVIQEAIQLKGQRIEEHAVDAWLDGKWQEIAKGTTVGYKRILRFSKVLTDKMRLRILKGRSTPSVSAVSAHYYAPRPPQLKLSRNLQGEVNIAPLKTDFDWKVEKDVEQVKVENTIIRYTLDLSEPNSSSKIFSTPFYLKSGVVKARAFNNNQEGPITEKEFGIVKKDWIVKGDATDKKKNAIKAVDADSNTFWNSGTGKPNLTIDLKTKKSITGFIYTPPINYKEGLIEKGLVQVSLNGKHWKNVQEFNLGNLINDPMPRTVKFNKFVKARYIKIMLINGAGGSTSASIAEIDILEQ
ncbi:alpha-L-fucosidase [Maribacter ulvicola]|nr:alpha-L-fucosidase [Maribacter ulvicola]